jgi:hypothetical protein
MSSMAISWIVFGAVFGGALLGMMLNARLPKHHMSDSSKDVVKLGMGLIATITALVLGLLIASAKSSFDAQRNGLAQLAANVECSPGCDNGPIDLEDNQVKPATILTALLWLFAYRLARYLPCEEPSPLRRNGEETVLFQRQPVASVREAAP